MNNFEYDKKKITMTCLNCGKIGHDQKHCKDPITSWGIIAIKMDDKSNNFYKNSFADRNGVPIQNIHDLDVVSKHMNSIKFLLVRRKHSLGYIEFVRGRYKPDNIDGIIFLFKQMTSLEIQRIGRNNFDEIWNEFWMDDQKKQTFFRREYLESKTKYEQLRDKIDVELSLEFYVKNVIPCYQTPEWGFPKGRKVKGESDLECAYREFVEETGYQRNDIQIIDSKPIVESVIGTNGIEYRHIYYLAELNTNKYPTIDPENNTQMLEIGDIGLFTYDEAYQIIREYHYNKRQIIRNIFFTYLESFVQKKRVARIDWTSREDDFDISV